MKPIVKLREFMEKQGYEGVLLRKRSNFSWLTEGRKNHIVLSDPLGVCDLLVFQDTVYMITNKMEEKRLAEEEAELFSFPVEVKSVDWTESTDSLILPLIKGKNVVADVPYAWLKTIDTELISVRSALSGAEMDRYRQVCRDAATALETTCRRLKPGMQETEIAAMLNSEAISRDLIVHVGLVATDERIYRYRHPIPTSKKLEKHAMLVICAERGGLVANATRFVYFGKLSESLEENKQKLARIDLAMNLATVPGKKMGDVIKAGMEEYRNAGFPEDWRLLHQGGLTGYATREFLATPESAEEIQIHQAFAWNPALPGIKSEDTILVTENGIEFMTHTGDWPYIRLESGRNIYHRPDILCR
ncbi:MAG TPA: M24 family metallopeptidase [Bacillaceae bacterium]